MKFIRVNLTAKNIDTLDVPEEYAGIGGRALTSRLINNEVPATCDPLGPENKLVFAPGYLLLRRKYDLPGDAGDPISRRLLVGAVLFGAGWGLGGFCPGPAIANLSVADWPARRLRNMPGYPSYRNFYTPDLIELVGAIYREDICRFRYEFASSSENIQHLQFGPPLRAESRDCVDAFQI